MTTLGVQFVVFSPELDYIASPDLKDKEDVKVSSRYFLILFFQAERIKPLFSYHKMRIYNSNTNITVREHWLVKRHTLAEAYLFGIGK